MAVYSEPNSFFQLNNPINFNCVEPVSTCLPIYEEDDLYHWKLITNDNPSSILIRYYYRLVANCNAPVGDDLQSDFKELFYYQIDSETWVLYPLTFGFPIPIPVIPYLGLDLFECGQCMYLQIIKRETVFVIDTGTTTNSIVGCIGCFQKVCDPCYTTKLIYRNNENAFDFKYTGIALSSLLFNQVRLPFYLKEPQFPTKRTVFNLSNGTQKKLASRIEKEWSVETDYMPKEWHEKLVIALEHDFIFLQNTNANVSSEFMNESNYEVDWQAFMNYPMAQAKFKLKQIPYNNVNSNCL